MKANRFRHFLVMYFTCTQGEKRAGLILSALLIVLQLSLWYRRNHASADLPVSAAQILDAERKLNANGGRVSGRRADASGSDGRFLHHELYAFDPNKVDSAGFVQLGLSPRQAASLLRYRDRRGGFKSKSELSKVRVLSPDLFKKWGPYILLPDSSPLARDKSNEVRTTQPSERRWKSEMPKVLMLDLNAADTFALEDLPFIGPGRARAIFNYREKLGGFHSIEQLREIRILPDSVIEIIAPRLHLGDGVYRKIRLNAFLADSLRHPYLPKPMARMIVAFRVQHGDYRDIQELKALPLVNDEILRKLAPYLTLNP